MIGDGARFALWCAIHKDSLPYFLVSWMVGRRFDLERLTPKTDDPLPRRLFWRRIFRPPLRADGSYIHGRCPMTVGRRFRTIQAVKGGDPFRALGIFYRLPSWLFWFGRYDKVNKLAHHMAKDLLARENRDKTLRTPLDEIQRMAGYDRLNHGLFGVIDYVATRNHLTYHHVEQLSDETLFAIMKIDHDNNAVQRREMEIRSKRNALGIGKTRRTR